MDGWKADFLKIKERAAAWVRESLPPLCVFCGETYTRSSAITDICPPCLSTLPWRHGDRACLQVLSNRIEQELDSREVQTAKQHRVIVPLYYEAELPRLLRQFKFHGQLQLTAALSGLMLHPVSRHALYPYDCVVAVPLHEKRLRERGYNQAYELSKSLAVELSVAELSSGLHRQKETARQSELIYAQRSENLKAAFIGDPRLLSRRHVLLVDDILTSGATLWSAMQAVLSAGAVSVTGLVVASGRKIEH